MTGRPGQFGDHSLTVLQEARESYLQTLRSNAPDSTLHSHQSTLRKFFSWYSSQAGSTQPPEKTLVGFAEYLLNNLNLRIDTVVGHIHSLQNFIAFYHESSPDAPLIGH